MPSDDEIIGLYARGLSVDEAAGLAGCSMKHVYNVLERNAFPLRSRKLPYRLESVNWTDVLRDYEGTELTVVELCRKHQLRTHELYIYLGMRPDIKRRSERGFAVYPARSGRQIRAFGRKPKLLPASWLDGAVQDYIDGVKVRDILMTHRLSNLTLYKELALRGVPLRSSAVSEGMKHGDAEDGVGP